MPPKPAGKFPRKRRVPEPEEGACPVAADEQFPVPDEDDVLPPLVQPPSRKKTKSAKPKRTGHLSLGGLNISVGPWTIGAIAYVAALILAAVIPGGSLLFLAVTCVTGWVIGMVGGFWIAWIMVRESPLCMLLNVLVPGYGLYYLVTRWDECEPAFLLNLKGIAVVIAGIGGAWIAGWGNLQVLDNLDRKTAGQVTISGGNAQSPDPTQPFAVSAVPVPAFPAIGPGRPLPGTQAMLHDIDLSLAPGNGVTPGSRMKMRLYLPAGAVHPGSIGCVLVGPAGTNLLCGSNLDDGSYHAETLPYAQAGYAALFFSIDGDLGAELSNATEAQFRSGYDQFRAACAGLVNARNALEFVRAKVPVVDPNRIYIAGHSSAAVLALLFAEHEPRVRGCIAYAPAADTEKRLSWVQYDPMAIAAMPEVKPFVKRSAPRTHMARLQCPVFLFQAQDDSNTSIVDTELFARDLTGLGKTVTFERVPRGEHYQAMIDEGIPRAIRWLQARDGSSSTAPAVTVAQAQPIVPQPGVPQPGTPQPAIPQPTAQPLPKIPGMPRPPSRPKRARSAPRVIGLQILGFSGNADQLTAARQALQGIRWIDLNTLAIDPAAHELRVEALGGFMNTQELKSPLTNAGFQIGATSIRGKK